MASKREKGLRRREGKKTRDSPSSLDSAGSFVGELKENQRCDIVRALFVGQITVNILYCFLLIQNLTHSFLGSVRKIQVKKSEKLNYYRSSSLFVLGKFGNFRFKKLNCYWKGKTDINAERDREREYKCSMSFYSYFSDDVTHT